VSYRIKTIPYFDKQAKRLSRKFISFKDVYMLTVFDKSEKESISNQEIQELLKMID